MLDDITRRVTAALTGMRRSPEGVRRELNTSTVGPERWFVCFGPVWPLRAGATIRHAQEIDALRGTDSGVLFITRDAPDADVIEWAQDLDLPVVWVAAPDATLTGKAAVAAAAVVRREPYLVAVTRRARRYAELTPGTPIVAAPGAAAGFVRPDETATSVLSLCDFDPEFAANQARAEQRRARRGLRSLNARLTERYVRRVYPEFRRIVTLTADDAEHVARAAPGATVRLVELGLATPAAGDPTTEPEPDPSDRLVFVGGGRRNLESILLTVDEVLPALHRLGRSTPLDVVGALTPAERRDVEIRVASAGLPPAAVRFHGRVEHLDALLGPGSILVAPFAHGAGVKVKCVDAMLRGALVATTHEGARGTPLHDGTTGIVDEASALATRIEEIGFGPTGARLAVAGRRAAHDAHSLERLRPAMADALLASSSGDPER